MGFVKKYASQSPVFIFLLNAPSMSESIFSRKNLPPTIDSKVINVIINKRTNECLCYFMMQTLFIIISHFIAIDARFVVVSLYTKYRIIHTIYI